MFSIFYDSMLLLLGILALPKLLWGLMRHGKYRASLPARLGFGLPDFSSKSQGPVIWIHSVSVGEAKAAAPLFQLIKENHPEARVFISSTTETGHAEAKRCMPGATHYFFLPFDFSWIIKKAIKRLSPDVLILVESDFWHHLIKYAKKSGASILLVNGKVSERSSRRFEKFQFFARKLFSPFDCICLQDGVYYDRFIKMGVEPKKTHITGNLKLDLNPPKLSPSEMDLWKQDLGISSDDRVIVIGSTHDPEEQQILSALEKIKEVIPKLKVLLLPRHPERFAETASRLRSQGFSVLKYSERADKRGDERVALIDAMGLLTTCYQLGEVAIVGGSFVQNVGGHNVFEPIQCGIPVIFGPYMHSQLDLSHRLLSANAAKQTSLSDLPHTLLDLLQDPETYAKYRQSAFKLAEETRGCAARTFTTIAPFLQKKH
jgi:3-deoxy-D-manno-octulosonic-acid transferase